jgi:hypothetical protein
VGKEIHVFELILAQYSCYSFFNDFGRKLCGVVVVVFKMLKSIVVLNFVHSTKTKVDQDGKVIKLLGEYHGYENNVFVHFIKRETL